MTAKHTVFDAKALAIGLACSMLILTAASARNDAASPPGEFAMQLDVGEPTKKGSTVYDPKTETYTLSGAGENMWLEKDEFHFSCRRMGNWHLTSGN